MKQIVPFKAPVDIVGPTGYFKQDMPLPKNIREEVVLIGRRLDRKGYIAGTDGNVSVRLDDTRILITPAGLAKGRLLEEQLVTVNLDGKVLDGYPSPSTEILVHLFIYRQRSDVMACVHSHAPFATAFAVAGKPLAEDILPELVLAVGKVAMTETYAATGTDAVPRSLEPFICDTNAFLLRNHGVLTTGKTLEEAYNRHETVEHYAQILHLAMQLGTVAKLPREEFERLEAIRLRHEQY